MPQLQRTGTRRLLKTVGGQPHARKEDHEDLDNMQSTTSMMTNTMEEEHHIYSEPISSDDEAEPTINPSPPLISGRSTQKKTLSQDSERRNSRKKSEIRVPKAGSYQSGREHRARKGLTENPDKENAGSAPEYSVNAMEDRAFDFGLHNDMQPRKKQKTTFGSKTRNAAATTNIHAQPQPVKRHGRPLPKKNTYSSKATSMVVKSAGHTWDVKAEPSQEEEDSEVSMLTDGELDDILNTGKKPKSPEVPSSPVKPARPKLLDQLGDYLQDKAPTSSQASSSASLLENVEDYIRELPDVSLEDSRCALCQAEVSQEYYWDFWKGKKKTVKNQTAFCNGHRQETAQKEYRDANYPEIDWDRLPRRVKRYRKELLQVLKNERPSEYRDRYKPISLTGKAAAVPSVRKDLSTETREELQYFALDDPRTYPGYYGPRGRRIMTEAIFPEFYAEISKCSDPVVQTSSPAAFIQAVLVPELAILLIMDDCGVGREEAEEVKEKSTEIGSLLHEEIEDRVDVRDESEEENDYDER